MEFNALGENVTFVPIKHYGFDKTGDERMEAVKDSCGFALVLASLKAYMEHGIHLNLVRDMTP